MIHLQPKNGIQEENSEQAKAKGVIPQRHPQQQKQALVQLLAMEKISLNIIIMMAQVYLAEEDQRGLDQPASTAIQVMVMANARTNITPLSTETDTSWLFTIQKVWITETEVSMKKTHT